VIIDNYFNLHHFSYFIIFNQFTISIILSIENFSVDETTPEPTMAPTMAFIEGDDETNSPTTFPTTTPTAPDDTTPPTTFPTTTSTAPDDTTVTANVNDPPTPGFECDKFAVHAGKKIDFQGAKTTVTHGSVGISPGTDISGKYVMIDGIFEPDSPNAKACQASKYPHFDHHRSFPCDYIIQNGDLSGLTLVPGVYCSGTHSWSTEEFSITVLDAGNRYDSKWLFLAPIGLLKTGKGSSVSLRKIII
jgi:hypothetical protein